MTAPVVNTVFVPGTTITHEWLNGVNDYVNDQTASQIPYTPPFTGGVVTTVQDKLSEYVSVKDFGAVGDGVTDDTDAIKNAVAASNTIYFPAGTYLISDAIYTRGAIDPVTGRYQGKKLFGAGITSTTIKAASGYTNSYMIHIGNKDYATNNNYCVGNQLSDMTIDNSNMGDTTSDCAVITFGTYNNLIANLQIGVIAYPFSRWDLAIDRGTYTTNVYNVNCQQMQLATAVTGDLTTVWVKGCSVTFLNIVGANAVSFDGLTVQGSRSVNYQANRIQISDSNNVSFINGDLEGDGTMFAIDNCSGIWVQNNNVAMPGSYTPYGGSATSSVFYSITSGNQILSRDNVFMNWNQGPLGAGAGTYFVDGGSNARAQLFDFQGAYFDGISYTRAASQSLTTSTVTVVNYSDIEFDQYSAVTTGASWHYTAPFRGAYNVTASLQMNGYNSSTDTNYLAIYVNGVEKYRGTAPSAYSKNSIQLQVSGTVLALAGQAIDVRVWSNSTSPGIEAAATGNYVNINMVNVY